MDSKHNTPWDKIIQSLCILYNGLQTIEVHVTLTFDMITITSLFHSQFCMDQDLQQELKSLDFETPKLYNMGRGMTSEFAFSCNHKYIIKVITHTQYSYFKKSLHAQYFEIIKDKNCLLAKTYGIYRLEDREHKTYFALMENLFYEHRENHIVSIYDLKGAQSYRTTKNFNDQFHQQQLSFKQNNYDTPLLKGKDEDFKNIRFFQDFQQAQKSIIMQKIRNESDLLGQAHAMDYSLMIICSYGTVQETSRVFKFSNIGITIGIIDYYQEYNSTKKLENKFKTWFGIHKPDQQISCVDSDTYRKRFQQYFQQFLDD